MADIVDRLLPVVGMFGIPIPLDEESVLAFPGPGLYQVPSLTVRSATIEPCWVDVRAEGDHLKLVRYGMQPHVMFDL
jgi:hypothetical protein